MEADVVRRDKIAAAKKKVWFTLLLPFNEEKLIQLHACFVALKHACRCCCVRWAYPY